MDNLEEEEDFEEEEFIIPCPRCRGTNTYWDLDRWRCGDCRYMWEEPNPWD